MRFNDLFDDCLLEVLDKLSPTNLVKMGHVNKRLQKLVEMKLRVKITFLVFHDYQWQGAFRCRPDYWNDDEFVTFDSMSVVMQSNEKRDESALRSDFLSPGKAMFFQMLARLVRVKSIDFRTKKLTDLILQKVIRLCPKIKRIRIQESVVSEVVWDAFLNRVGHQIISFHWIETRCFLDIPTTSRLFEMIALTCSNIQEVNIFVRDLKSDLVSSLKKLPETCFVAVNCVACWHFEDTINHLNVDQINWVIFGSRNERLTRLELFCVSGFDSDVEFTALKSLNYKSCWSNFSYKWPDLDYFTTSWFPVLEVFRFTAPPEDLILPEEYDVLFITMPEVKQLHIEYTLQRDRDIVEESLLPGSAILRLEKLEQISLSIENISLDWGLTKFIRQMAYYVRKIPSLKCLSVDVSKTQGWDNKSLQLLDESLEKLKRMQSRVEIINNLT